MDEPLKNCCAETEFCTCPERESEDPGILLSHMIQHFVVIEWHLHYRTLSSEPGRYLCRVGICSRCGKRFCSGTSLPDDISTDSFLATTYRWFYQMIFAAKGGIAVSAFRERFLGLFHEVDRPTVSEWLERPENQSLWQMYRH